MARSVRPEGFAGLFHPCNDTTVPISLCVVDNAEVIRVCREPDQYRQVGLCEVNALKPPTIRGVLRSWEMIGSWIGIRTVLRPDFVRSRTGRRIEIFGGDPKGRAEGSRLGLRPRS